MDHRRKEYEHVGTVQGEADKRRDQLPDGAHVEATQPHPLPDYADVNIHHIVCTALQQAIEYIVIGRYQSALLRLQHDRGQFPLILNLRKCDDGQFLADSGDADITGGGSPFTLYVVDASALTVAQAAERHLLETLLQAQATRVDVLLQLSHGSKTDTLRGSSGSADDQLHKDSFGNGV